MEPVIEENETQQRNHEKTESSLTIATCVEEDDDTSISNFESESTTNEVANPAQFIRSQTSGGTFGEVKIENSQDVHFGNKIFTAPITVVNAVGEEEQDKLGILGALRERFPNNFLKNDIFDQLNNGKQSCNLIWYAVTGGVLIVTAIVLISVTVTVWNTQNQSMEAEKETEELFINESWFIPRSVWHAKNPVTRELLHLPVDYLSVCHTVSKPYNDSDSCTNYIVGLQMDSMHIQELPDIPFNYLVCGNGHIYEGTGSNAIGSHTYGINFNSIGLGFIGDYSRRDFLNDQQIENAQLLLSILVNKGKLSPDYKLIPSESVNALDSPGKNIINVIKNWDHYQYGLSPKKTF